MKDAYVKKQILFLCTHNSARSQIAEGFVNALLRDGYEAKSAGTEPGRIHKIAIQVMQEAGIDISHQRSKAINPFLNIEFDYVVTVCDNAAELCPFFPRGKERIHQSFPDPAAVTGSDEEKLEAFRRIRDQIRSWIFSTFI